jgi:hypothetical protein
MTSVIRSFLLAVLPVFGVAPAADQDSSASILDAVFRYVFENGTFVDRRGTRSVIQVDARIFTLTGRIPHVEPTAARHTPATLSKLNIDGIARTVSAERAELCAAFAPVECMDNGFSVVASFSQPVIAGDSASVELFVRVSQHVSKQDSIANANRPGYRMGFRMARASASLVRIHAKRAATGWAVQRVATLSRT